MPDEPKNDQPEEIQSILSDLDAILGGQPGAAPPPPAAAAPPPAAPPAPAPKPVEPPKPEPAKAAEPPKPAPAPAPAVAPKIELGATPPPAAKPPEPATPAAPPPSIELAPREGMIKPAPKPVEPPKPAAPPPPPPPPPAAAAPPAPKPAEPPKAAEPPKPAESPKSAAPAPAAPAAAAPAAVPAAAPAASEPIPEGVTKDHIRRVAYVYAPSHAETKATLAAFLSQAGRTISKKPLYLREVLSMEALEPAIVLERVKKAKAVVVLAVVEGWAKADLLADACEAAGIQYHAIAPGDAQKKSMAVDVIVDMMLLQGED